MHDDEAVISAGPRHSARTFELSGDRVAVIVDGSAPDGRGAQFATLLAHAQLQDVHRRLSRADPASELSQLNGAGEAVVPASRLMRRLARAVVEAGERSGGLVDATCLGALEPADHASPGARLGPPDVHELIAAPARRRPARPHPDRAWASIEVDAGAHTITRPPGVRLDGGGLATGLGADLLASTLAGYPAFAIDCAGDVRIGGSAGRPRTVLVPNPFGGPPVHRVQLRSGAAATSAIAQRSWRGADGSVGHELLDPATGRPAWTGVVQATAFAPTALEAEILARTALLRGPDDGRFALVHGGVLILEDASVHVVEALAGQPV
jgi:thiamine biosynthesis lipoprotein